MRRAGALSPFRPVSSAVYCDTGTPEKTSFAKGFMSFNSTLKSWGRRMKRDGVTLWFAGKHRRTPWYAKALGVFVVAYALSPIDLIPDFIPVLGYLDDVLLLPCLIWFAIKLLPPDVLAECRRQADDWMREQRAKPRSPAGAVAIVTLWVALAVAAGYWLWPRG